MKKTNILIALICVFLLIQTAYGQTTQKLTQPDTGELKVSFIGQDPSPVEPGEFVELRWKVENYGQIPINDAIFEIDTKYPFTLDSEMNRKKSVGTISPRQIGDQGVILEWRVRVDENAVEGDEDININYYVGKSVVKLDPYKISVRTRDIILSVENVSITPERIKAGENANIAITIKNLADSYVDDVKVKLNLDDSTLVSIGSSNEKVIRKLSGKEEVTIIFVVATDAKAQSKVHKIPLTIQFKDSFNEEYTLNTNFGVIIDSPPDYTINLEDTKVYSKGETGDIVISISNIGVSDINFVTLQIIPTQNYDVVTTDKFYLGNLESDDFETAEFKIHINEGENEIPIEAMLTYKDSFNREYNKKVKIPLKIYSKSDAKKYGLVQGGNNLWIMALLLAVIVSAYFIYKRKTKSKNIKEVYKKLKERA